MNETVAVTAAVGTTGEVEFRDYRAGMVFVPAASSITTLTFHVAPKAGGTYLPLYTAAGAAVALTVAHTRAYALPAELAGCRAFKMVGNAAGNVEVSFQRSFEQ